VANANVALVVSQPAQPNITSLGTLTGIYATGNLTATFFTGGGNALSNIQSSSLVGNVANANVALVVSQPAQPNITSLGILTSMNVSGTANIVNIFTSGTANVTTANIANIYTTNIVGFIGSQWVTGVSNIYYLSNVGIGTSAVSANLHVQGNIYASNSITTTNIQASSFTSNLTDTVFAQDTLTIPFIYSTTLNVASGANIAVLNVTTATNLSSVYVSSLNVTGVSNMTAVWGSLATPLQPNITSVSAAGKTFTVNGLLIAGNASGLSNINSSNLVGNVANANVALVVSQPAQPNITSLGTLTGIYATGNLTATFFTGGGNALSNIQSSSLVGNVANANVALVVSQPAQPNITSLGTLTGIYATGNLTATFFSGGGNALSNIQSSSLVGNVANANVALVVSQASQPNITSVGTTATVFTVNGLLIAGNASGLSNINSSNLVGNVANANVALVVSQPAQPNITSVGTLGTLIVSGNANLATLNVTSISTPMPVPASSGLFMNLNATYSLNSTGNWTGNIAGSITSNLYTLFASNPIADWTAYGANPLITGPTANGGFRFSRAGAYVFTIVLCADNNIKTIALSSNTADIHSNLADPGVWMYCYRISVGQDPSVPVTIPFYASDTSRYYYIDFEAMNKTDNIHRTAYTNVTYEGYTGSYVTIRPV
jgi:hypothetical protein